MEAQANFRDWLLSRWRDRFAAALGAMTGVPIVKSELPPAEAPAADWWEQAFSLGPEAKIWIGAPEETWKLFGRVALEAAGIGDASDDDVKGTYQEMLIQSLSGVASALTSALGSEVSCAAGATAPAPPGEPFGTDFQLEGLGGGVLYFAASPALSQPGQSASEDAPVALAVSSTPRSASPYDLLLDVEMPVSVSFGRAHIPLKEVLKLTSGSIVELNRAVTEPVEIIVNNCVVAKGEVVVVEGNYGVRIHQVISRGERLRTLY